MQDKSKVELDAITRAARATITEVEVEQERRENILLNNRWVVKGLLAELPKDFSRLEGVTLAQERWLRAQVAYITAKLFNGKVC